MKQTLLTVLIAVFTCLLTACITEDAASDSGDIIRPGQQLPDFTATLSDGTTVSPSSLAGKVAVIAFFNTTCSDCRRELPVVQQIHEAYPADQVAVVCISRAQGEADVGTYWEKEGLTLPYSAQNDRGLYNLFARIGIPRLYIADRSGTVRHVFTGGKTSFKKLSQSIDALR